MKKILLLLLALLIPVAAQAINQCESVLTTGTNCTMVTPTLSSCSNNSYKVINTTLDGGTLVNQGILASYYSTDIFYFNFSQKRGAYLVELCDGTTREIIVSDFGRDDNGMIIAMLILIPMLLGLIFIIAAATLSEEHAVLKIFLFLLTGVLFMVSLLFSLFGVAKYYEFIELQTIIGRTLFWFGIVWGVLLVYFIIYAIRNMFKYMQEKEKERLEY